MASPSAFALAPLSAVYGGVMRVRLALYETGVLASHRIDAPVISVGNITVGGTGKTPLVEWLARAVAREGKRVCILTRGYGRSDAGKRVTVSDGTRLLAGAREGGDEPRLLAESLLGVASVVCDRDRVAAARWAASNLGAEVFVLDDAFQHLRIARDLNIVTIDSTAPWGGRHLLPRGRLREPLSALRRAGCIVLTRTDLADNLDELRIEAVRLSAGRTPVFASRVRTLRVRPFPARAAASGTTNEVLVELDAASEVLGEAAAAFCAIGNPQAFFTHLLKDGHNLCYTWSFPDHHQFTQEDLDVAAREAKSRGARLLLTTAKDAVKLHSLRLELPLYVVEIATEFDDEGGMLDLVHKAIS